MIWLKVAPSKSNPSASLGQSWGVSNQIKVGVLSMKVLISPLAEGSILQVLFVAVLFGISLAAIGDCGRPIVDILNNLTAPVFYLVGMLMKLAPIGAFGAMAFTIGAYGIASI